ncbi:hypothetical protein ILUMI_24548 [Ignelater luminosus]|uniref:RNA-directed DNA polymerase n=1 Tax=Ignelater luminosus TaxID=2038154 RepID=A0A8K0CD82_IGNLU|nr:hypothetical protein ILUMI_24548 [Ignelater luminosus]
MINYYGRLIKNLSSILYPLNRLLCKNTKFIWSKECQKSFELVKQKLQSEEFLANFDPKLPLVLATDASAYGVGAVLSHVYSNGEERVIQYAPQTLSETQRKYSQIDKEAYAIIFGIKKFHQYFYGNTFTLYVDHKPLVQILSPQKGLPVYSAMRMQHYALYLQGFNYQIKYRNTKDHGNSDCLSRLPINESKFDHDVINVFQIETIETLPITEKDLAFYTDRDPDLKKIIGNLQTGINIAEKDRFHITQNEFSLQQGILMRGHRAVIPKQLRTRILQELYEGHLGVVKMKGLARGFCWWPGIDREIENLAKTCKNCNLERNNPAIVEKHIWKPCAQPFERIHADFAERFMGKYFFILVDSFTKYPFVYIMKDIRAKSTINVCREIFAAFGLPKLFVSDNGPTFTSYQFKQFLSQNGTILKVIAPYHPATNGQAERFIQTLKKSLLKLQCNNSNLDQNLQKLLLQYRTMPHTTTNEHHQC